MVNFRKDSAAVGIGTLIIFIAMILIAGIVASVLLQTMNQLQHQAIKTGQETISDVSTGLRISQISGKVNSSKISILAIMVSPLYSTSTVDLFRTIIYLSDANSEVILTYNTTCYSSSVDLGLFNSLNTSILQPNEFGIVIIRDDDGSCTQNIPIANEDDLVVVIINTTKCFSGITARTEVFGRITPEQGIPSIISCTVPSVLIDGIVDL